LTSIHCYKKRLLSETCGICGGKVKIIAAIKEGEVIKKILDHIGLPSVPPEIASARGPPDFAYDDNFSHDTNPFFLRLSITLKVQ